MCRLLEGGVALALLIGLQFVVTWTSVRVAWVRKAVTGEPSLLLYQGEVLVDALRRTRVTEDELRSAVRSAGLEAFAQAQAVVLETDASFSVIKRQCDGADRAEKLAILSDVWRP